MLTTMEVQAIFRLKDEASNALRRIAEQTAGIDSQLKSLATQAAAMQTEIKRTFGALTSTLDALKAQIAPVLGELERAVKLAQGFATAAVEASGAAAAAHRISVGPTGPRIPPPAAPWGMGPGGPGGPGPPGGGGPGPGGGGGRGGGRGFGGVTGNVIAARQSVFGQAVGSSYFHTYGSMPFQPAGMHTRINLGGNAALVAAAAGIWGSEELMKLEDFLTQMQPSIHHIEGRNTNPQARAGEMKGLMDVILRVSTKTGISPNEVALAAMAEVRQSIGMSYEQRMQMMEPVLLGAAREARMKGGSFHGAVEAIMGAYHQVGAFTPEKMQEILPYITTLFPMDPRTPGQIVRSLGYNLPTGKALLDIDPGQLMTANVIMGQTGVGGKAGTWIRELIERSIVPDPNLMSETMYNRRIGALSQLGLIQKGEGPGSIAGYQSTWADYDPKTNRQTFNLDKLMDRISQFKTRIGMENLNELVDVEKMEFGERGKGASALLGAMYERYRTVRAEQAKGTVSNEEWWRQQMEMSPLLQQKAAWVEMQKVLMEIGAYLQGPMVQALTVFRDQLKTLSNFFQLAGFKPMEAGGQVSDTAKYTMYGAEAGAALGFMTPIPGGTVAGALLGGAFGNVLGRASDAIKQSGPQPPNLGFEYLAPTGPSINLGPPAAAPEEKTDKRSSLTSPPGAVANIIVPVRLEIDGQALAKVVSTRQAQAGEFPTGGASFDGSRGFPSPDAQSYP